MEEALRLTPVQVVTVLSARARAADPPPPRGTPEQFMAMFAGIAGTGR